MVVNLGRGIFKNAPSQIGWNKLGAWTYIVVKRW